MKKLVLIFTAVCATTFYVSAQYYLGPSGTGNPNEINNEDLEYPVGGGLPSGWTVIQGGGQTSAVWSPTQSIPFSFKFNNNTVTQYKVSTSGVLTFSTAHAGVPGHVNYALPHSSIPNQSVCVWGVSGKSNNDNIVAKTFGTAPNRQHWISFNDYSLPAIFNSHYNYWSIVLEESTNNIYIVDQRTPTNITTALTLGVQVNDTLAIDVSGSPAYNSTSTGSPTRSDNNYFTFIQGVQPNRDLKGITTLINKIIAQTDGPFPIRFVFQNMGKDTVQSMDLNYSFAGGLKTTATITNLSVGPWGIDTVLHPTLWNPTVGNKILKVWATNINLSADENNSNDTVLRSVNVLQDFAPRTPLIESFTSSTSPQSKNANDQLQNVLGNETQPYTHVKFPMNWPGTGDPYYTNEAGGRRQYYNVTTVPNMQLDGTDWSNFNYSISPSALNGSRNERSLISMFTKYYLSNQQVCAEVDIDPLVNMANSNLTLYVAVYEKTSTGNIKNSGETVFYNIMKKMLPDHNGTSINNLTAGTTEQVNLCFTFNGNYILPPNANSPVNLNNNHTIENFNNLGVVAWLQDDNTKEVLQSSEAYESIDIDEYGLNSNFRLFPNPASGEVHIQTSTNTRTNAQVDVVDMTGKRIMAHRFTAGAGDNIYTINTSPLKGGIYFVRLTINNSTSVQKLIIH